MNSPFWLLHGRLHGLDFQSILQVAREELGAVMYEVFAVCLWCIWFSRNKSVMDAAEVEGMGSASNLDFQWAAQFLARFHEVQDSASKSGSVLP